MERVFTTSAIDPFGACPLLDLSAGASRSRISLAETEFAVVESGLVAVRSRRPPARRSVITLLAGRGATLLPPDARDTLCALADSRLRLLGAQAVESLLADPAGRGTLLEGLAESLRRTQEAVATLAAFRHVDRVRSCFLRLARDFGRVSPAGGIRIDVPLTHDLLAEMVGSARETVSRAVEQLEREGLVFRSGRSYRVLVTPASLDADCPVTILTATGDAAA
jgi:CRP/FNR family transcriptional regulator